MSPIQPNMVTRVLWLWMEKKGRGLITFELDPSTPFRAGLGPIGQKLYYSTTSEARKNYEKGIDWSA